MADFFVYVMIIIGPVVGRFAILYSDNRWQYLYWGGFVCAIVTDVGLFFLYRECRKTCTRHRHTDCK